MNKKLEAEFIKWAEARDDDWWEKGEGHISIWDVRVILEFFHSQQLELLEKIKKWLIDQELGEINCHITHHELGEGYNQALLNTRHKISELEKEI